MKILKIILGIIVVLIILFFAVGAFLPKTYSVNRSTVINAPDSVVYNNIADFNEFVKWNPWSKKEPGMKSSVTGTPGEPGHIWSWEGDEMGSGSMKILGVTPYTMIDLDLNFIKPFESQADTKFDLEPAEGGTKVTWTMSGDNDSYFARWMSLMMDSMIGKDFEEGLAGLKEKSEK